MRTGGTLPLSRSAPSRPQMPDPHLVHHYKWIDLDSVLKYDTVKSWYGSRIGDGRKTALYHFAGYHRWRASSGEASPRVSAAV